MTSSPQNLSLHHLFPGAWISSASPILTNQTMFEDLKSIINEHWPTNVSHLTLQPKTYDPIDMPILVHVSAHVSFFPSAWMIIVTAVSVWLCWGLTHQPLPPIFIPVVNAATFSTNQTVQTILQASFSFGEILANIMIITLAFLCW
jgi:hypothetical protein